MSTSNFLTEVVSAGNNLFSLALKLTRNSENAQDLVQETVYKALKNKEKFRENNNLQGWLFTIMRNIFINQYNRNARHPMIYQDVYPDYMLNQSNSITGNDAPTNMSMEEIMEEISKVDVKYVKPFMMHYEGFKYEEIAEEMNLPLGTVKTRIHKARKFLQKALLERHRMGGLMPDFKVEE